MTKIRRARPRASESQTNAPKRVPETKSFSDHIGELRRRIFVVALVFVAASSVAYNYREELIRLIMMPLGDEKLIYLTPGGGFNFIFQVALYAGLIAAAPVLIHQLYGFIRPALPGKAQRSAGKVALVAFLLMLCGVAFGYFIAVPSALNFLSNFAGSDIAPSLTADSYLSFFLAYIAGLGVLFELPLLLLFFHWIHPMTPGKLLKSERFVVLFAFIASAIITPTPDVLNQSMIAVPLIAIYQLGVIVVLITIRRDHKRLHKAAQTVSPVSVKKEPVMPNVVVNPAPLPPPSVQLQQSRVAAPPMPVKQPVKRSIDGFATAASRPTALRPQMTVRPAAKLAPPPRPSQQYRRSLSVDGIS